MYQGGGSGANILVSWNCRYSPGKNKILEQSAMFDFLDLVLFVLIILL